MEKINLSNTEKKMLGALNISQYNSDMSIKLSREELYAASNRLIGARYLLLKSDNMRPISINIFSSFSSRIIFNALASITIEFKFLQI
jgi:hypothetical protein